MKFFNTIFSFLKNLIIYTIKKIYSFFIYIFLTIVLFGGIAGCAVATTSSIKSTKNYDTLILKDIEIPGEDIFTNSISSIEGKSHSFRDIINALDMVVSDEKIKNIIIDTDYFSLSEAQKEEIKPIFEKIKLSGKKVYAYSDEYNNSNYSIALLADEIVTPRYTSSQMSLKGYFVNSMYYKNIFDKYGIKMEVIHVGTHKSFGETYSRSTMSDEKKETLKRIYDIRFDEFINNISQARKIDKDALNKKVLNGEYVFLNPEKARDLSLVDTLMDYNTLLEELDIDEESTISINEYIENIHSDSISDSENKIAVIYLDGDIESETSYKSTNITSKTFKDKLNEAASYHVGGIVIRINSGGGSAFESKKIYDMISDIDIPVYISIGSVAASGGYYIASSGDRIFADKNSITGSIGVVSIIPKYINALNKLGINVDGIKNGKYVDIFSPSHELDAEEKELFTNSLKELYQEFKNDILVKRTNLNQESLEKIAQGQIWTGSEALQNGLIDNIGGLYDTIDALQKELEYDNDYTLINIYSSQKYDNLFDEFINNVSLKVLKKQKINFDFIENKLNFLLNQNGKMMYLLPESEIYIK